MSLHKRFVVVCHSTALLGVLSGVAFYLVEDSRVFLLVNTMILCVIALSWFFTALKFRRVGLSLERQLAKYKVREGQYEIKV
ncbi:MAG: hypothetical protein AAB501_03975 [Patescibacteria group bacterium]